VDYSVWLKDHQYWFLVVFDIHVAPIYRESNQLMCYKQNPFSVGALNNLQFLLDGLQPIIGVHWLDRVRNHRRLGPLEFTKLAACLPWSVA
jgi:hypothetical protein